MTGWFRLLFVAGLLASGPSMAQDGPKGIAFVQAPEQGGGVCLGATPEEGFSCAVAQCMESGATDADARAIGFDEGPKPKDWTRPLIERGIAVQTEVLRADAKSVLEEYARSGGIIYSPCERE